MILIDHGVPWSVAWALKEHEALAMIVLIGEAQGGEFDWDKMQWKDKT